LPEEAKNHIGEKTFEARQSQQEAEEARFEGAGTDVHH
jgi:hypothetical protein